MSLLSPLEAIKKGALKILAEGKEAVTDFKTNSGAFAADKPLGFTKNVVKEIPGSANTVIKDILRGGASVALDTGEAIPRIVSTARQIANTGDVPGQGQGEVARMVVPPKELPGPVGKYLGPLQSFSSQYNQKINEGVGTKRAGAEAALDIALNEPAGLAFKPVIAIGSIIGKPLVETLFKRFGKLSKTLAETTDTAVIDNTLRKMGTPEEVIEHARPGLVAAKTEEEAQKALADSYDAIQPKYQGGKFNPPDTYDAYKLSKGTKNSLFQDSSGKFNKPDRFVGKEYSYKEARTGLAENGQDIKGRIVIGKDGKGNVILKDGTHLLEAYRDLRLPVPKNKVVFEDGIKSIDDLGKTSLPEVLTADKLKRNAKNNFGAKAEAIAQSNDPIEITKILRSTSVDPEKIPAMAAKLAKVDSPRLVKNTIEGFETTRKPRAEIRLADPEARDELEMLLVQKEMIENTGFQSLQKFESKSGEFKGQLNINNGTGAFAKNYDTRLREVFQDHDNKHGSSELIEKYEDLKRSYKAITDRIKEVSAGPKVAKVSPLESVTGQKTSTKTKQANSTAEAAERSLDKVDPKYRREVFSLPSMIEKTQTNVKAKVNLLDYLRTPDRVLNKLGFGTEAKLLKQQYDKYVMELPKNIEKIRAWSDEIGGGQETSEKIFKFLDGQRGITLNAKETKVANEIKEYLADWADRLGLPKDNRIANYITHIFDSELIQKEFDEDLAKIIADKLPGEVYDPFLEKRLGAKGYKQDVWAALDAYVKRATRKVHMDPALEVVQDKAGHSLEFAKIEASQYKYIQRYINGVQMRPTEFDNLLDNSIKTLVGYKYGQRPVTYLTKLLRRMTYRGMLGLNPASALRNLSQGINTYATLGEKYTALGYAGLFKKGAMQEIEDSGILGSTFIQDQTLSATKKALEKVDKGLFAFFSAAEKVNRGAAYFGAKAKYLANFEEGAVKLTPEQLEKKAANYAREVVRKTQFSFGSVDTPVFLQSDIAKTMAQYQTFTLKQTEFLAEMAKNKDYMGLLRYSVAGLAFVYSIGQAFNMEPKEILPMFRFDTPPSLKTPVEIVKAVADSPDKYGNDRTLGRKVKDISKQAINLFPGGSQIKKTFEGTKSVIEGGSFDGGGNIQYEAPETALGKAKSIIMGKAKTKEAESYFDKMAGEESEDTKAIRPLYEKAQKLLAEGKEAEAQEVVDSLGDKGYEIYKKLRSADKAEKTKQGKRDILPTYQKAKKLIKAGKQEEAQALVDSLTDEEYKYYEAVKKQLETQ